MNFSQLDKFMDNMPYLGFPAAELSVAKDGEIVYRKSVGYSDSQSTKPVTSKDLYWLYSTSKVITCIAAMQLVERGVIALSDPVSKYIPEYANLKVKARDGSLSDAKNTMTVEHLFTMCGGMTYDIGNKILKEAAEATPSTIDMVKAMAKMPLSFEPGTQYQYSLCHDVLGAVVEVASGMKFSEYLKKNLFDPLGVIDMGFRPTEEQKARFSAQYCAENGTGRIFERPIENPYALSNEYDSGGAGLFGTVDDYMKVITPLACGGVSADGYRVLKPETIKMMGENRLNDDCLRTYFSTRLYGYGWGLCGRAHTDPVRSLGRSPVGEFGWDGAAAAYTLIDPVNHVSLFFGTHVFGCQYAYHIIHSTIRDKVYEALEL